MTQAKYGDIVQIHYTLYATADGATADATPPQEPLEVIIGADQTLPGIEEALIGMQPGETKYVHIPVEKAFGSYRDELVVIGDRQRFSGAQPQVGQTVHFQISTGDIVPATVRTVSETHVTVDANHPLAGQAFDCEVQLVAIVSDTE